MRIARKTLHIVLCALTMALTTSHSLCAQRHNPPQPTKQKPHLNIPPKNQHDNQKFLLPPKDNIRWSQMSIRPISDKDFSFVLTKVKEGSFSKDKISIIEVACLNNHFTCRQTLSLLKQISFDNDRLKALRIIEPYIVDRENSLIIIETFSFSSSKDQAIKILTK